MMTTYPLFISCPRNMEYLLADEVKALGLAITKTSPMGVYGDADLKTLYNICLWSRLANRVQLILFSGKVADAKAFYQRCRQFHWPSLFTVDKSLAIEFHGSNRFINSTMFGAQLIKDAVVDTFRAETDERPMIDKQLPDIRLQAHIKYQTLTVSLDLVGYSLHQRGYREATGGAPLKENVAAALLMRCQWPSLAAEGYAFVDPCCGSGTLLIEAALMAANIAPGLLRSDQALKHWLGHDDELWQQCRADAQSARRAITNSISGYDNDKKVLIKARDNIANAGLSQYINVCHQSVAGFTAPSYAHGLLLTNPPYGERLSDPLQLKPLYQQLGQALATHCRGWQAGVLTADPNLAAAIGLRVDKTYQFYNGPLPVTLSTYTLDEQNQYREPAPKRLSASAEALRNRLLKNQKALNKWLKREVITCYRLYDADIPEYAFAIDIYNDWAHVQEYAPPKTVPEKVAAKHTQELLQVLPQVLELPDNHIVLKQRQQQKGKQQYQALNQKREQMTVYEGGVKLLVNLHDYLDTGLFLDYRPLRKQFSDKAPGRRFLNLFCYTASVSVHAALAGAQTTNVDMSKTYIDWAMQNFKINRLALKGHRFIQADCLQWLRQCREKFDAIFLDPPSFSNSKRMQTTFDVQRDHAALIEQTMRLLAPGGALYFSTNKKKFVLADDVCEKFAVKEITPQTIDPDFKRTPEIHRCYLISKNNG